MLYISTSIWVLHTLNAGWNFNFQRFLSRKAKKSKKFCKKITFFPALLWPSIRLSSIKTFPFLETASGKVSANGGLSLPELSWMWSTGQNLYEDTYISSPPGFEHWVACINFFLLFFSFLAQKMLKMDILTRVWSAQHPNAGQNIQQTHY